MPRPPSNGRVTASYGPRPKPTPTSPAFHYGEDTVGKGNYAPASGRVIQAAYVGAYGNRVVIDAGGGVHWWVCHNASMAVSAGQWVTEGQWIGALGSTGNVTGPHAHTERRTGATKAGTGTATNPRSSYTAAAGADVTPIGDDMEFKEEVFAERDPLDYGRTLRPKKGWEFLESVDYRTRRAELQLNGEVPSVISQIRDAVQALATPDAAVQAKALAPLLVPELIKGIGEGLTTDDDLDDLQTAIISSLANNSAALLAAIDRVDEATADQIRARLAG